MLILIPLAIVCGAIALGGRRAPASPASPTSVGVYHVADRQPTPLHVFCAFVRSGKRPPSFVVQCAIAEAKLLGRHDLACQLLETFGAMQEPIAMPQPGGASQHDDDAPASEPAPQRPAAGQSPPPGVMAFRMPDEEQGAQGQPDAGGHDPGIAVAGAVTQAPAATRSPIPGVRDAAWGEFARRLVREAATFDSNRHVGRYRHNKHRVAEIGFDPRELVGAPAIQDAALAADVADVYRHVANAGDIDAWIGRPVAIPDHDETPAVTLSGVLGVASVAGLEGAIDWLENKADRKRFPHTTAAFMVTNGVF